MAGIGASARRRLIDGLRNRLVPELEQRGYVQVELSNDEKRSEVGAAFPFGRLRKRTANGFELIEIQFHKNGGPSFRLNGGRVPAQGIEHVVGHVKAEDVWVHYLDHFCELYSSRLFRRWFALKGALHADDASAQIENLVASVVALVPQIEDYLAHRTVGRNLRCV